MNEPAIPLTKNGGEGDKVNGDNWLAGPLAHRQVDVKDSFFPPSSSSKQQN